MLALGWGGPCGAAPDPAPEDATDVGSVPDAADPGCWCCAARAEAGAAAPWGTAGLPGRRRGSGLGALDGLSTWLAGDRVRAVGGVAWVGPWADEDPDRRRAAARAVLEGPFDVPAWFRAEAAIDHALAGLRTGALDAARARLDGVTPGSGVQDVWRRCVQLEVATRRRDVVASRALASELEAAATRLGWDAPAVLAAWVRTGTLDGPRRPSSEAYAATMAVAARARDAGLDVLWRAAVLRAAALSPTDRVAEVLADLDRMRVDATLVGDAAAVGATAMATLRVATRARLSSTVSRAADVLLGDGVVPWLRADAARVVEVAEALADVGRLERAAALLELAGVRWDDAPPAGLPATACTRLGRVAALLGDADAALGHHEQAVAAARRAGPPAAEAAALQGLATALSRLGRFDEVAEALDAMQGVATAAGSASLARAAVTMQAWNALRLRDYAGTLRFVAAADPAGTRADRLLDGMRAVAYLQTGRPDEALAACRRALDGLDVSYEGLADLAGARVREQLGLRELAAAGILAAAGTTDTQFLLACAELLRGVGVVEGLLARSRLEVVRRARLDETGLPAAREALERARHATYVASRRGDLTAMRRLHEAERAAEHAVTDVADRVERGLRATLAGTVRPAPRVDDVRQGLGVDEALVVYTVVDDRVHALVFTPSAVQSRFVGAEEDVARALEPLDQPAADRPPRPGELDRARALLVDGLRLPGSVRHVWVVPDGVVASVAVGELFEPRTCACVPCCAAWLDLERRGGGGGVDVLAVGAPDYHAPLGGGARLEQPRLPPLPATLDEVRSVGTVLLTGARATPEALRRALAERPRWSAVHLACHGVDDPEDPLRSRLALTGGDLMAYEVMFDRVPADLVVLSACQTARAETTATDGAIGWVRSLLYAGSRCVVGSLWKVDDDATAAFMKGLHREYRQTRDAGRALRKAQAAVRAVPAWRNRYYWAAWQLWGLPTRRG